jgi:hypothetical protein
VKIALEELERLRIGGTSPQFLCICPRCGCRDCHYNTAKMVWNCFHCPAQGMIIGGSFDETAVIPKEIVLDIPKIRDLYVSLADKYHSNLIGAPLEYLVNRGLTTTTINKFKLGFCTDDYYDEYNDPVAEDAGVMTRKIPSLLNRIVIPYTANGIVVDLRGRTVPSLTYRPNTPKYLSLTGARRSRGSVFLFNHDVLQRTNSVIVTEGEFKAIMADQCGFSIVATPGVNSWDRGWAPLFKDKEVTLVADYDQSSGMNTPAYTMTKTLIRDIPQLKVSDLQWVGRKDKLDIDTLLLREGGVGTFKRALAGAIKARDWMIMEETHGRGRKLKSR